MATARRVPQRAQRDPQRVQGELLIHVRRRHGDEGVDPHRHWRRFSDTERIPFISADSLLASNILGTARENSRRTTDDENINGEQCAIITASVCDGRN